MKTILISEICNEKPNSSALGAFNSALINTGGNIKDYGKPMYALFNSAGEQVTRGIQGKLGSSSRQEAIKQLNFGNKNKEINAIVGTRKLGRAIRRF